LIAGLVLIGPFVRGSASGLSKLFYSALFARPWGPAFWSIYYATLYPSHKPADFADYRAALRANLTEAGRLEALKQMMLASKAASEARLPQVASPTLVLMGTKDPDFKDPQAEARAVADSLNGSYTMIEGAGHYPHAEMPEITGPLVLAFLQTLKEKARHPHAA
jgi:pimeloyl-ACP methyl ester carboxylesterase